MDFKKMRRMLRNASAAALTLSVVSTMMTCDTLAAIGVEAGASKVVSIAVGEETSVSDNSTAPESTDAETIVIEVPKISEEAAKSKKEAVEQDTKNATTSSTWGNIVMANVEESLNVRAEASEDSELIGKLYKNTGGQIVEQSGDWTKFKSGNLTGWAKNDFLLFGQDAVALADSVVEVTAIVKTDSLRVRKEASEEAGVYGLLAVDDEALVVDEMGDWVSIQYSDDTVGYVASKYVTVVRELGTGQTMKEIKAVEEAEAALKAKEAEEKAKVEASRTTETTLTNNGAVTGDVNDVMLLAALIQCEAGYETYAGQVSVGTVVMNRLKIGNYGNTVYSVIYAKNQFGPAGSGKVAAVYAQGPRAICVQAAQEAMAGTSYIGAATHFRNIRSGYPGVVIGNHVFW
ncbi:MAG: cell wall hydrolase [bacterium]|nr:cell wall hydrolase [bacterium]